MKRTLISSTPVPSADFDFQDAGEQLAVLVADLWSRAVAEDEADDVKAETFEEHGEQWLRLALPESQEDHEGTFAVVECGHVERPGESWGELEEL